PSRCRANAIRMGERSIVRREVPGHDAIRYPATPLEVSVAPLPCVAKDEAGVVHSGSPTEVQPRDGNGARGQLDTERAREISARHDDLAVRPSPARAVEIEIARRRLHHHTVGPSVQVMKPQGQPGGLRLNEVRSDRYGE